MPRKVATRILGLLKRKKAERTGALAIDRQASGLGVRQYASYEEYLAHQSEKLGKRRDEIEKSDREYEQVVSARYADRLDWRGKTVLCLAARLGGEVRAFKSLGAAAIGIDIEPGPANGHVLPGDVHDVQFPDASIDVVFTNALDHFLYLDRVLAEVLRVLKPGGSFLAEIAYGSSVRPEAWNYEVVDMTDPEPVIAVIRSCFEIVEVVNVRNATSFIEWDGIALTCRKRLAPDAGIR